MPGRQKTSLADRFYGKVRKTDSCWLWTGYVSTTGYGVLWNYTLRRQESVHRIAWKLGHGTEIPAGMFVCHHCDVKRCVRLDHLFLGTPADNSRDRDRKGRGIKPPVLRGERSPWTVLSSGDILTIRQMSRSGLSGPRIAGYFAVNVSTINRILKGERWSHV